MNYKQSVEYLNIFNKNKIKMGLERMTLLMSKLGNPQDKLKFAHVTGTNGKGSIVAYLTNIMMLDGQCVGGFISPHLVKVNESILINAKSIDNDAFANAVTSVEQVIAGSELEEELTSFEVLTAVAINYFYITKCDLVILEVGMGGALDSTNIITHTLVAIIAKISLDHTDYLGKTLQEIATVKCGIIKPNCTVIIAPEQKPNVIEVIVQKCESLKVKSIEVCTDYSDYQYQGSYQSWHVAGLGELQTTLLGKHQIANAMTAVGAARALGAVEKIIAEGIANTRWQCRLELVQNTPRIFIDGGHNLDGINAVVEFFKENYSARKVKLIFGVLKDKQYHEMIKLLADITESVAIVQVASARAANVDELGAIFGQLSIKNSQHYDLYEAIACTIQNAKSDDIILIIGSLYYVGKAREIIVKRQEECN